MRAVLYGLSVAGMLAAGLGLSLLVRFSPSFLRFAVGGSVFTAALWGGWVLSGATAGNWPRPRAGPMLVAAGLTGALVNLVTTHWLPMLWSLAVAVGGLSLIIPVFGAVRRRNSAGFPGPVRPPLGRREPM